MARAIRKRKDLAWYTQFCMQASVNGRKVSRSFEELFPDYTAGEEAVAIPEETAKLMERLAAEQLAKLEKEHGRPK